MLLWNDLDPAQRISVYDKGVEIDAGGATTRAGSGYVSYHRRHDRTRPSEYEYEALGAMVAELVPPFARVGKPLTDWSSPDCA